MKKLTEITKTIRAELKEKFPGHKFSVVTQHGLAITVSLMTAPEMPFASFNTVNGYAHRGKYAQLNIKQNWEGNWISNGYYLTEQAVKLLNAVVEIGNRENWDNSDAQIDHFDVNYYLHLQIGKWNKPFVVKVK